jgi:hypothetical protein
VVVGVHVMRNSVAGAVKSRVVSSSGFSEAYLVDGGGSAFDCLGVGGARSK